MSDDEALRVTECRRCGDLVLAGRVDGFAMTLCPRTVPFVHAVVLAHYGTPVVAAVRGFLGLYAKGWAPGPRPSDRTHLLVAHTCGAPHNRVRRKS